MKLLIVIPFCKKDLQATVRLLDWLNVLGGCRNNPCVLVSDSECSKHEISKISLMTLGLFSVVTHISTPFKLPDESHPIGPNWMFETAIKNINVPFLWLEPDAVPVRSNWLTSIEAEYSIAVAQGKKFLADVTELKDPRYPQMIPSGVAVYPGDAKDYYRALQLNRKKAWDIQFADAIMPMVYKSSVIQNIINHQNPPDVKLSELKPGCALFHPSKNGSLIEQLRAEINKPKTASFYHSGDLGDIIYSLPLIKKLGGGKLFLGPYIKSNERPYETRGVLDKKQFDWIAPLLKAQPYITGVEFTESDPKADYDLNLFRTTWLNKDRKSKTLADCYFEHFRVEGFDHKQPWLISDKFRPTMSHVVIHRSQRYHNPSFPWRQIMGQYPDAIFLGTPEEKLDFQKYTGHRLVSSIHLDALGLAKAIASADLFLGNQSLPCAIALGLGVRVIQEVYRKSGDCILDRPENEYVRNGQVSLSSVPQIHVHPKRIDNGQVLIGPCHNAYGLGDMLSITPVVKQLGSKCRLQLPHKLNNYAPLFAGLCGVEFVENFPVWPPNSNHEHQNEYKLKLMGIPTEDFLPFVKLAPQEIEWGKEQVMHYKKRDKREVIAFVPTCASKWKNRMRDIEFWESFFADEKRLIMQFGRIDFPTLSKAIKMPFYGLRELASFYAAIKNYVGVDTGDQHLMLAVGGRCFTVVPDEDDHYKHWEWHYKSPRATYSGFNEAKENYEKWNSNL